MTTHAPYVKSNAKPCCRRRLFGATPAVGDEARKGFPQTAMWRTITSAGSALLTQASPPWRTHSRIQNVFRRIGSRPQRPGLRGHPFKVLQGPSRRLRRKSSFSTRVVKYWNRLPTPSVNSFKRHLDSAWRKLFAEVLPSIPPPHPQ